MRNHSKSRGLDRATARGLEMRKSKLDTTLDREFARLYVSAACDRLLGELGRHGRYTVYAAGATQAPPLPAPVGCGPPKATFVCRFTAAWEKPTGGLAAWPGFYYDKVLTVYEQAPGVLVATCSGLQCSQLGCTCRHVLCFNKGRHGRGDASDMWVRGGDVPVSRQGCCGAFGAKAVLRVQQTCYCVCCKPS